MSVHRSQSVGISTIELLAIAAVIGVILFLLIPRLTTTDEAARAQLNARHKAVINAAVERFYVENGRWPVEDLSDLAMDTSCFPDGLPENPLSGSHYKLDVTTHRVE